MTVAGAEIAWVVGTLSWKAMFDGDYIPLLSVRVVASNGLVVTIFCLLSLATAVLTISKALHAVSDIYWVCVISCFSKDLTSCPCAR